MEGAQPGHTLAIEIVDLHPQGWGWTAILPGFGLLPDDFPDAYLKIFDLTGGEFTYLRDDIAIPIAPFLGTMGVCLPFIKEGKLVALGVTTPERAPVLPDVPTLGEVLPEFKRPETTHGLVAPTGTPRPILMELNKQIARILALPDVKERLNNISYVISTSTPEEYDKILRSQIEGLATLVRAAGLKPK